MLPIGTLEHANRRHERAASAGAITTAAVVYVARIEAERAVVAVVATARQWANETVTMATLEALARFIAATMPACGATRRRAFWRQAQTLLRQRLTTRTAPVAMYPIPIPIPIPLLIVATARALLSLRLLLALLPLRNAIMSATGSLSAFARALGGPMHGISQIYKLSLSLFLTMRSMLIACSVAHCIYPWEQRGNAQMRRYRALRLCLWAERYASQFPRGAVSASAPYLIRFSSCEGT